MLTLRRLILAAFGVAALVATTGSSSQIAVHLIAFQRAAGNSQAIYLVAPDGTGERLLTRGFAHAWSPDGTRLAFQRYVRGSVTALYVINRDGSGFRRLVANIRGAISSGRDFTWSPDGRKLAFSIYRVPSGGPGIGVIGADGKGLRRLTRGEDKTPTWAPDGSRIAVSRFTGTYELVSVMANGSAERVLPIGVDNTQYPAWSPDGRKIAFQAGGVLPLSWDIYVANADGSGAANLTRSSVPDDTYAQWSPDGRWIAFESTIRRFTDVHTMGADGTRHRNLTRGPRSDESPSWSPDGRSIAFSSVRDGNLDVYVMTAAGRNPTNLTNNAVGTRNSAPAWSP